jgi:DNA polymerase
VARYLRQQGELGGQEFFLGELNRDEVLSLASRREGPETDSTPLAASEEYEKLRKEALACRKCALARTRTNVVFSDGNHRARLMVVGEAPGAQEDKTGLAFVGPAGKLLDLLLASVDLSRESSAYICNVLKCRPPGNRNPLPGEIQECTPFLRRQIEVIAPEAILAVGTFSAQFLTGKALPLGRLRGDVYIYQGVPLVVTYHPAALLRNPGWTTATWDDFQLLRQVLDGA